MRQYRRYLILLISLLCFVDVMLAFAQQNGLELYVVSNFLIFIVITQLSFGSNRRANRALIPMILVFSLGYLAVKIVETLNLIGAVHFLI